MKTTLISNIQSEKMNRCGFLLLSDYYIKDQMSKYSNISL